MKCPFCFIDEVLTSFILSPFWYLFIVWFKASKSADAWWSFIDLFLLSFSVGGTKQNSTYRLLISFIFTYFLYFDKRKLTLFFTFLEILSFWRMPDDYLNEAWIESSTFIKFEMFRWDPLFVPDSPLFILPKIDVYWYWGMFYSSINGDFLLLGGIFLFWGFTMYLIDFFLLDFSECPDSKDWKLFEFFSFSFDSFFLIRFFVRYFSITERMFET